VARHAVSAWRQTLARSIYLAALAIAMAGWVWTLLSALGWMLGSLRLTG
jgi:hypothetical protein